MCHRFAISLLVVVLVAAGVFAGETKGKIKFLNVKKGTMTLTVGDKGEKDVDFVVPSSAKVVDADGKELPMRLKVFKAGDEVIVTTGKDGDKDVVTEVKKK